MKMKIIGKNSKITKIIWKMQKIIKRNDVWEMYPINSLYKSIRLITYTQQQRHKQVYMTNCIHLSVCVSTCTSRINLTLH